MNREEKIRTFDRESSFEEKLFVAVGSVVAFIAVISAVATVFEELGRTQSIMAIICAVVVLGILAVAFSRQAFETGYFVMCLALNCALIPVTFFTNGGFNSGMPFFLAGTFVLSTFCTNKTHRKVASIASAVCIVGSFILAGKCPGLVTPVRESFVYLDYIFSFAFIAFTLYALVTTIYEELQRDHNKALTVSSIDLLHAVFSGRGKETEDHMKRVGDISAALAEMAAAVYKDVAFTEDDVERIRSAAAFHDIGESKIPESILLKEGALTETEQQLWQTHPQLGAELLETMRQVIVKETYGCMQDIVLCHHERFDGTGFPKGLKGEEIPFSAQIAGAADTFEGLLTGRLKGTSLDPEKAAAVMASGEYGGFSPRILSLVTEHAAELAACCGSGQNEK